MTDDKRCEWCAQPVNAEHELAEANAEIARHHQLIIWMRAMLGSAIAELESLRDGETPFTKAVKEGLNRNVG